MKYGIIGNGKVAEWLKALVLKTRDGNIRRFESCPFRQKYVIISLWQEKSNCDLFPNRIAIIITNTATSANTRASKTVAKK